MVLIRPVEVEILKQQQVPLMLELHYRYRKLHLPMTGPVPATGFASSYGPYALMVVLAGAVAFVLFRKKRAEY